MNGSLKMYKLILFFNILLLSQFSFSKNDCDVPIVPSTKDGVVKSINVEDGQPVEYGQTLVIIE